MKIIEVIPLTKIPLPNTQILTYFTNKVNINWGSLVMAPLGKRKIPAIAINSRSLEDEKMNIRKARFQLSPIKEVLSAKPVISPKQFELAFWMHEYYYEPLGLILKSMLPKNIDSIPLHSGDVPQGHNFKFLISNQTPNSKLQIPKLLQSDIKNNINPSLRRTVLLQSNIRDGVHYFQKEIEKTLAEKKQVLILAPEINILEKINKLLPHNSVTITSKTSQKKSRNFCLPPPAINGLTGKITGQRLQTLFIGKNQNTTISF